MRATTAALTATDIAPDVWPEGNDTFASLVAPVKCASGRWRPTAILSARVANLAMTVDSRIGTKSSTMVVISSSSVVPASTNAIANAGVTAYASMLLSVSAVWRSSQRNALRAPTSRLVGSHHRHGLA